MLVEKKITRDSGLSVQAVSSSLNSKRYVRGIFWVGGILICFWAAVCR